MAETKDTLTAPELRRLLDAGRWYRLRRALDALHPADVAELLEGVGASQEILFLR
ncbi:MAG: magnesium transporter, partial [Holophaga sp.]|nr:magnesium transporter [Holophaga sp.]